MASKRQRKKLYKKMGLWGFDGIIVSNGSVAVRRNGWFHGFEIGTPVKFMKEQGSSPREIHCTGFVVDHGEQWQVVYVADIKKIR